MSEEKEQHIDGKDAGWPENIMQPQPAEQETDAEYQDRLTRELVARQKVIQKPAEQSVEIGKDGMCGCSAADKCPLGKTGSEPRCTIAELDKAEQSASGPDVWLTEELIKKNSRGMSSTELLDFCAEFEARVRQDEREKCFEPLLKRADEIMDSERQGTTERIRQTEAKRDDLFSKLAAARVEVERLAGVAFKAGVMDHAPCFYCGYNGEGYYQPDKHPCAARHHKAMEGLK
jgi:hypothetical protein